MLMITLDVIPVDNPLWDEFAGYLEEMVVNLPELQDEKTDIGFSYPFEKMIQTIGSKVLAQPCSPTEFYQH